MKIKQSKPVWFIAIFIIIAIALALSFYTRQHFDYTTGRVRTSQHIAWITYNSQTEDTWITPYASKDTPPVWLSMHINTPMLSPRYYSDGARLRNDILTFKSFLDNINADDQSRTLFATTFFKSLNQTTPGIDPVQATLDSYQCIYWNFPRPPHKQPITFEELQTLINNCFPTILHE